MITSLNNPNVMITKGRESRSSSHRTEIDHTVDNGNGLYPLPKRNQTARKGCCPKSGAGPGLTGINSSIPRSWERFWRTKPNPGPGKRFLTVWTPSCPTPTVIPSTGMTSSTPPGASESILARAIKHAIEGNTQEGDVLWQTVLSQVIGAFKQVFLRLTSGQRKRFEKMYGSVFFSHTATQSIINAEKPLALIRAGIVEIIIQFMVARGIVLTETFRLDDSAGEDNTAPRAVPYSTGNIWIDQETHQPCSKGAMDGQGLPHPFMR